MNKTSVLYLRSGTTKRKITRPVGSENTGSHPDFPKKCLRVSIRALPTGNPKWVARFRSTKTDDYVLLLLKTNMRAGKLRIVRTPQKLFCVACP